MLQRAAIVYFAFASALSAQTIVVNDNIVTSPHPDGTRFRISKGVNDALGIDCGPAGCFTTIVLEYDAAMLAPGVRTLDEQSDWFLVQSGDVFSAATIAAGQFPILFDSNWPNAPLGGPLTVGSGECPGSA
jgi:hypothetical protein